MKRHCPNCGAIVPPESLNCPHCYHDVPRTLTETEYETHNRTREQYDDQMSKRHKSRTVSLILATIPALIGLLGLAQIYQDHREPLGWKILVGGLILYLFMVGMVRLVINTGGLSLLLLIVPIFILLVMYLLLALFALLLTYSGFVSLFGRRV